MGVVIACKIKLAVRACPVTLKFRLHHFFVRTNAALPEPFLEPQNFLFHPSSQLMLQVFRLTIKQKAACGSVSGYSLEGHLFG